ncbi:acyl-CoA thioesterase [Citricoccus sp. GCM10030269]|uniref:acyl-CoA thioesterase n=1 Tax=Citricoccus sp. GCM10030269 TaxID=3273388 RepID=UPI003622F513
MTLSDDAGRGGTARDLTGQVSQRPDGGVGVRVEIPLRWGDMDAYGHINNVRVAALLEEARIHAFGVPGGTGADGLPAPVSLLDAVPDTVQVLIAEHRIRYRRPLEYRTVPAEVWVWIDAVKAASIEVAYSVRDGWDGTECVTAATTMVFVDAATGRPARLTEAQKSTLNSLTSPTPASDGRKCPNTPGNST